MKPTSLREEMFNELRTKVARYKYDDDTKLNNLFFLRQQSLRMTIIGVEALSHIYEPFTFDNKRKSILTKDLLALSRYCDYPYFINNRVVILFDRKIAFMLKMVDGNFDLCFDPLRKNS